MHLLWLPNELLELIVSFVDVDDIEDVGLCCSRLRHVSVGRLDEHREYRQRYQSVRIGPQYEHTGAEFKDRTVVHEFEGHPVNVLMAIHHNARVARYIRRLHFAAGDALYFAREGGIRPHTRTNLARIGWLVGVLETMGVEGAWAKHAAASRRLADPMPGHLDTSTMFAYLLTLAQQVRQVSLSPGNENTFTKQAWKIFEHQATRSNQLLLSQLERVSILDKARRSELCATFLPFVRWTGVKRLHALGGRNDVKPASMAVYACPPVEAIELEDSLVSDAALDMLLQHCPGLVSLRFVAGTTASAKNKTNDKLRPAHLTQMLENHCAATLQKLSLDVVNMEHAVAVTVDDLRGLASLRVLSLHASHYFGDTAQEAPWLSETPAETLTRLLSVLPPSIETLVVKFEQPWEHGPRRRRHGEDELVALIDRDLAVMREAFGHAQRSGLGRLQRGTCLCGHRKWLLAHT